MINARLLGPPVLDVDGDAPPPELLWRKNLALCLLLWLAPDRRRSRDHLLAMLWAEKPEAAARHSLNEALRVIRRIAGDSAIASTAGDVAWLGEVMLDLGQFVELAGTAPEAAAELVRGELCQGFTVPDASPFEEWLAGERRDWTARSVAAMTRAAAIADDRGNSEVAAEFGVRALRLSPFSDLAARSLIRSRWLLGDRGGAVAVGREFKEALASSLGTAPDPLTAALLDDIGRARKAVSAPTAAAARRPPLIGRESALATLLDGWRTSVASKQAGIIVIEGDPGAGRTRMLEELLARAAIEGTTTSVVRAVEADAEAGELGLVGLLHGTLLGAPGVSAAPPAALAAFAAVFPEWAERYPAVRGLAAMPPIDALTAVLRATSEERPMIIGIDDVDRIDRRSQLALPGLVRSLGAGQIVFVLTLPRGSTDTASEELRRSAGREHRGAVLRLSLWTHEELEELVEWSLPEWAKADQHRLGRRLLAESGGIPAIAVEMLDAVVHGLALDSPTATWPLPDRTMDQTLPASMPAPLVAAIRMAFRRLDPNAQELLTMAALLPEPVDEERLRELQEIAADDQAAMLDRLEWECWLVADARGYSFRARVVRRLIADEMLTPGQRQRLLKRIAGG